jgi:hypothetical protein
MNFPATDIVERLRRGMEALKSLITTELENAQ